MQVLPVVFKQFNISVQKSVDNPCELISAFCKSFSLPDAQRNHADFDENLVRRIASYKDEAVKPVIDMLKTADNEKDITAGLFLLNRIIDAGAKNAAENYHIISKFNYSPSSNIQVMLSGIYRKTLVPDAFGPLMTMFLKNSENPRTVPFDPNEEVGGAILEYLRNTNAHDGYSNFLKK